MVLLTEYVFSFQYLPHERESLVPQPVVADDDQDDDIELNGVDEVEDPLLKLEARPVLEETPSLRSSQESFDPLYERVKRSVEVAVEPVPQDEMQEAKIEPIYAKVINSASCHLHDGTSCCQVFEFGWLSRRQPKTIEWKQCDLLNI